MRASWRAGQLLGMGLWLAGSTLGCTDPGALEVAGPPRSTIASKAPSAAPTLAATQPPASTPSPKWTLPAPTPTPTQVPYRTPIPQESVELPDPTPTPYEPWEPPVDDPTPES